ncbi:CNNM domain-containing protein [Vibrio splendidus]|nr:CNNM domain-containing protein [Vibrio splendidus]MCC4880542.1 CNNM domain-containing protein [Vibrio splendidus]
MQLILLTGAAVTVGVISAFCSLAEASIVGLSDLGIKKLKQQNEKHAELLTKVLRNRSKYLSATIMLNTITNIGGSMFVGTLAAKVLSGAENHGIITYSTFLALMTFLMLLFSEIKPKVFAAQKSEVVGVAIHYPLAFITWLLTPIVNTVNGFLNNKDSDDNNSVSLLEVEHLISMASESGTLKQSETSLLINFLNLKSKTASVMVDKEPNIVTINVTDTIMTHKDLVLGLEHKKIVLTNHRGNAVGVALKEEVLAAIINDQNVSFASIMHSLPVVSEDHNLACIAQEIHDAPAKIIAVADDKGQVRGVISLTDIKEVLFAY